MDTNLDPKFTKSEALMQQGPYQQCPQHPNRKIKYIYIDPNQQRYLACNNCAINTDIKQIKLICIQDVLESDDSTIFEHWPFINQELVDKAFKNELKTIISNRQVQNDRVVSIQKFFSDLSKNIIETLNSVEKKMIMQANGVQNLTDEVKNCYNKFSAKEKLRNIAMDVKQSFEEMNQNLKNVFKQDKTNECYQEIKKHIQEVKKKESAINMQQPEEMKNLILKYIEKIDFFQKKQDNLEIKYPNKITLTSSKTSQIIYKLINNRFNKCPSDFLEKIQQKLHLLDNIFDDIVIEEKWKQEIYQNDLEKIGDKFETLDAIAQKFLNYQNELLKSRISSNSNYSSQLNSTADISYSKIEDRENLQIIIELINNKFNYCSQQFKEAIISDLHNISHYFSVLDLPNQYQNKEQKNKFEKVIQLNDSQFSEISYLIDNLSENKPEIINEKANHLKETLQSANQGLIQEPFLGQFQNYLTHMPQIIVNLFYKQKVKNVPLSISTKDLSNEQINLYIKLINQTIVNNQKISKNCLHLANQLSCYNINKNDITKLLIIFPIFDLLKYDNLYSNQIAMEFEYRSIGAEKNVIKITKNNYNQQNIKIEKCFNSFIFTTTNLDISKNYIIRMKFNQRIGIHYVALGIEDMFDKDKNIENLNSFFISKTQNKIDTIRGNKDFLGFIYSQDLIELRINFKAQKLYLAEYPTYQNIYCINQNLVLSPQSYYRFVLRFGNQVDNLSVDIIDCQQVDNYLVEYFGNNKNILY